MQKYHGVRRFGFLILANRDPERFNRGQHVGFLRLFGDVVTAVLTGCDASGFAGRVRRSKAFGRRLKDVAGVGRQQVFPRYS